VVKGEPTAAVTAESRIFNQPNDIHTERQYPAAYERAVAFARGGFWAAAILVL
jgi:hypothetical protein